MALGAIPAGDADGNVHVLVESACGSRAKYAYDVTLRLVTFDRTLSSAVYFPTGHGFIPGTRSSNGEALHALVLGGEPAFLGGAALRCHEQ